MTWEEWVQQHPPEQVEEEPSLPLFVSPDDTIESLIEAENVRDRREEGEDGAACQVLLYKGRYYVVYVG